MFIQINAELELALIIDDPFMPLHSRSAGSFVGSGSAGGMFSGKMIASLLVKTSPGAIRKGINH